MIWSKVTHGPLRSIFLLLWFKRLIKYLKLVNRRLLNLEEPLEIIISLFHHFADEEIKIQRSRVFSS